MAIKVIAFDADDTLWVNEPYFRETEDRFCELLEDYLPQHTTAQELFKIEMNNLALYGYGVKGFMLSMIEAALEVTQYTLDVKVIERILDLGKELLEKPVHLLDDVEEVLAELRSRYRLVVATKGDLLDQQRKLRKSGLEHFFHHIEILSDKRTKEYTRLVGHLDIKADQFMMIGNSLRSDILPVLEIGAYATHVPFHTTWVHEEIDHHVEHDNFREVKRLRDILEFL